MMHSRSQSDILLSKGISVIVPVYNSEGSLGKLISRLHPVLQDCADRYEVILVNDGSRDSSWDVITRLTKDFDWVTGINLARNYGQHNTLLCGIRQARYDVCVTIDDDLQNPPEEIPKLLAKLSEGYDVVYGPPEAEKHGLFRDMASRVTKLAQQSAMGAETARSVSAFRVFRTWVRDAFARYQGSYVSIDVLLTWGTTRFAAVPVEHDARTVGKSNYTFYKLFSHAMNMVTGFSTLPLQLASWLGFAFMFFGLGILAYVVVLYLVRGHSVPGFPFLASVISIFSGVQLFVLGVFGEYLARMHFRIMDKPTYAVRAISAVVDEDEQ